MARPRIALVGAGHWHLGLFLPTLAEEGEIAGVHDPDPAVAERLGAELGCPAWTDDAGLLDALAPDFVLVLGAHDEMAAAAHRLLDRGIPFAVEKPCGLASGQVRAVADRARASGTFAAVPFVWRQSELLAAMRARFADDEIDYLSFRWIAGPPGRYTESGCGWMLDRARSGGGCTVNLSVHLVDLARVLLGPVEVAASTMSDAAHGCGVEDYSLVTLRSGDRLFTVETGYLMPAPHSVFDMRFTVKARRHYLVATGPDDVEVVGPDGAVEHLRARTTNVPHYPVFVRDALRRVREGAPPVASLDDAAAALELVETAYRVAGRAA
jgi:predicted dehydrogenase